MIDTVSILAALRSLADDPLFIRIEVLELTRNLIKARLYCARTFSSRSIATIDRKSPTC